MTKPTISSMNFNNMVLFSNDDTEFNEIKEAVSSTVSDNITLSWAKFILTDDQPNENKKRVPKSEFSNLIRSGTYMPFKMAYEKPNEGHEESFPLGVIAQLKQSGNQIVALAALWRREREQDIEYLKTCIAEKKPVNVSWEILHDDSKVDEAGIEDLIGTSLRGVTIVGRPAYAGRTPVLQLASTETGQEQSNSEENKLDELEQLKQRVSELEAALANKDTELTKRDTLITEKETELVSLREFKSSIEQKDAALAKFQEVKDIFSNAGLVKPDTYFEENKEKLLSMNKGDLEFMVQELVAFSSTITKEDKSATDEIPDLTGDAPKELTVKELAEELRKSSKNLEE
jgi:hypothetical protein